MSTPIDEVQIDIDEIDRLKAEDAAKSGKNGAKPPEKDAIEVIRSDAEAKPEPREVLKPEEGLEKLKKQLDDEKIARADAERRAQESAEAEARAKTEVQGGQLDLVTNAIATVTQANDVLETRYAEALAAQDYAAAAKAQREMGTNSAKLLQLEQGKQALERAPKPTVRTPIDAVEQFASRLSPQSGAWVRSHPDYVRDSKKNREMMAAHELALARGHVADTEGYFNSIEKTLDIAKPNQIAIETHDEPDATSDAAKPTARRGAPPAAPVSRSGNGAGGGRPNVVTLSSQEVEMASMMGMTAEEYARQKVALKKEGRLN